MKKTIEYISILIIIVFIYVLFNYKRIKIDGLKNEFFNVIFFVNTEYSGEYSHEKYLQIHKGISLREVILILGKPYHAWKEDKYIILSYSFNKASDYRIRKIKLLNNKVVEVITGTYLD